METFSGSSNHCVSIPKELNIHTVSTVADEFSQLSENGVKNLLLDMAEVKFIDSTGLALLVKAYRQVVKQNGNLIMYSVDPTIQSFLELSRMTSLFTLVPDQQAAFALIQSKT